MKRNSIPIAIGAVVTAVLTGFLFVAGTFLPMDAIRVSLFERTGFWFEEGFAQFRLLGGVPGGLLAGYLSRGRFDNNSPRAGVKSGMAASVLGLAILYGAFVVFGFSYSIFVSQSFPAVYFIFVVPLIIGFPLFPAFLFTGFVTGLIGNELSILRGR